MYLCYQAVQCAPHATPSVCMTNQYPHTHTHASHLVSMSGPQHAPASIWLPSCFHGTFRQRGISASTDTLHEFVQRSSKILSDNSEKSGGGGLNRAQIARLKPERKKLFISSPSLLLATGTRRLHTHRYKPTHVAWTVFYSMRSSCETQHLKQAVPGRAAPMNIWKYLEKYVLFSSDSQTQTCRNEQEFWRCCRCHLDSVQAVEAICFQGNLNYFQNNIKQKCL